MGRRKRKTDRKKVRTVLKETKDRDKEERHKEKMREKKIEIMTNP
jgi:hypothetical protein